MEARLECMAYPGQFSGEYAVTMDTIRGRVSLFATDAEVELESPLDNGPVGATLRVTVIETSGNHLLVKLPRPALETGEFVTVDQARVRQEA